MNGSPFADHPRGLREPGGAFSEDELRRQTVMHARELVELSGYLAVHSGQITQQASPLPRGAMHQFWSTSKCRLDRWFRALRYLQSQAKISGLQNRNTICNGFRPVFEEIILSDTLTRVWAAICSGSESDELQEAAPIARNIFHAHLEARNRAFSFLVSGQGLRVEDAVKLNRLRRKNERWSDMLLAACVRAGEPEAFAFHKRRVREYAVDFRRTNPARDALLLASLRGSFPRSSTPAANPDLNRAVAASVMGCLQSSLFDSTGLLRSYWLERLSQVTNDTCGALEALITQEPQEALNRQGERRLRDSLDRFGD